MSLSFKRAHQRKEKKRCSDKELIGACFDATRYMYSYAWSLHLVDVQFRLCYYCQERDEYNENGSESTWNQYKYADTDGGAIVFYDWKRCWPQHITRAHYFSQTHIVHSSFHHYCAVLYKAKAFQVDNAYYVPLCFFLLLLLLLLPLQTLKWFSHGMNLKYEHKISYSIRVKSIEYYVSHTILKWDVVELVCLVYVIDTFTSTFFHPHSILFNFFFSLSLFFKTKLYYSDETTNIYGMKKISITKVFKSSFGMHGDELKMKWK